MPRIFWFLFVAMLAAWLSMNLWTLPRIEEAAGGLRLLDMRFAGYSYEEASVFIAGLGEHGVALYLGAQFWLDMIFPPLLGAVLFLLYRWLFSSSFGLLIGTISQSYVLVDIFENLAVKAMLNAGADNLTPEMVAKASQWTAVKWNLALIGLAMLVMGVLVRLRRRWIRSRTWV